MYRTCVCVCLLGILRNYKPDPTNPFKGRRGAPVRICLCKTSIFYMAVWSLNARFRTFSLPPSNSAGRRDPEKYPWNFSGRCLTLVQLRVWIVEVIFGNSDGPFWLSFAHWGPSGPQNSILEGPTALRASRESSVADLGLWFWSFLSEVRRIVENVDVGVWISYTMISEVSPRV